MRHFVLLVVVTFAFYTKQQATDPDYKAKLQANQTACAQENGVQVSDAVKIWTDPDFPSNNQALKCYYKCMCVNLGIIDNGKYDNVDAMKVFANSESPQELKELQDECKDTPNNGDDCEFGYQLLKCIAEAQLD